jgi:uncharacterized membrane protein (UPF0127 family)
MNKKNAIQLVFLIIFVFFLFNIPPKPEHITYVKIAGQSVKVDVVATFAEREKGLSGRAGLRDTEGMFFIFDTPGDYPFWMKDMNFPIDIIWISENKEIVYIKKYARPELYPEIYDPHMNSKYVLEVVAGFSDKNNLNIGDKIEFLR